MKKTIKKIERIIRNSRVQRDFDRKMAENSLLTYDVTNRF
jgi:hypothetical protein